MLHDPHTRAFPQAELGVTPRSMALSALMKEHELSFAPKPAEGQGRGRTYAYTDEEFVELYKAASSVTGAERKRLCDEYDIGYETLRKKAGAAPASKKRASKGAGSPAPSRQLSIFDQIDALAGNVETALEELETERAELQARIEEIDRKKEVLVRISEVAGERSEG